MTGDERRRRNSSVFIIWRLQWTGSMGWLWRTVAGYLGPNRLTERTWKTTEGAEEAYGAVARRRGRPEGGAPRQVDGVEEEDVARLGAASGKKVCGLEAART